MNKKILIGMILLLVLASYSFAAAPSSVIGYIAEFKNGNWHWKAICSDPKLCEAMQWTTDPSGKVAGETMGGFKAALGEDGAKAVDAAQQLEGGLTPERIGEVLASQNEELKKVSDALRSIQQEGKAEELKAETRGGEIISLEPVDIHDHAVVSKVAGMEKEKGSVEVADVKNVRKAKERNWADIELEGSENSVLVIRDKEGRIINQIENFDGDAQVGPDGLKELKGKTTKETEFNIKQDGQNKKVKVPKGVEVEYDRDQNELRLKNLKGEPITLTNLEKNGKAGAPFKEEESIKLTPFKYTPTTGEELAERKLTVPDYEDILITRNKETGNMQIRGRTIIEQNGHKARITGWGNSKRGEVEVIEKNTYKLLDRFTKIKNEEGTIILGGKKGAIVDIEEEKEIVRGKKMEDWEWSGRFWKEKEYTEYADTASVKWKQEDEDYVGGVLQGDVEVGTDGLLKKIESKGPSTTVFEFGEESIKVETKPATAIGVLKKGESIAGNYRKAFQKANGRYPTVREEFRATEKLLELNGLTYAEARKLPIGYEYKTILPGGETTVTMRDGDTIRIKEEELYYPPKSIEREEKKSELTKKPTTMRITLRKLVYEGTSDDDGTVYCVEEEGGCIGEFRLIPPYPYKKAKPEEEGRLSEEKRKHIREMLKIQGD